jgi:hypothetical protein
MSRSVGARFSVGAYVCLYNKVRLFSLAQEKSQTRFWWVWIGCDKLRVFNKGSTAYARIPANVYFFRWLVSNNSLIIVKIQVQSKIKNMIKAIVLAKNV